MNEPIQKQYLPFSRFGKVTLALIDGEYFYVTKWFCFVSFKNSYSQNVYSRGYTNGLQFRVR